MKAKRKQMKSKAIIFTLFIACCLMTVANSFAQNVGINPSGLNPDNSAGLDVNFPDKGLLIPRMTEAQRNAIVSPAMGLQVFNLDTKCINMWIGTTWKQSCFDCDFNAPVPGNNGPICQGSTLNLTSTTILGATYQWAGPNGFTSTDQNPFILNATAGASGSYSVTATKNGCTSTPQSTVATVNTTPVTPTAGNDGPKCVGAILNLTATTVVGATYNWTGPNGYSASVQNPLISSAALTHAGTYNVIATVNGCASAAGTTTVTINAIPATPGSISGPASACPSSPGNVYSIAAVSGATSYTWSIPSGTITAGQGTTSITVTFGTSQGNITVTASNVCGTSSASSKTVTYGVCGTGGTITNVGGYTIHTFTNSGTFTTGGSGNVEVLVVAGGGGGGGDRSGGGGAGGLVYNSSYSVNASQSITVTVGAGGSGISSGQGSNGGNSIFGTITAIGGGGGGFFAGNGGSSGGSGGGGGSCLNCSSSAGTPAGAGTASQGNNGGNGNGGAGGGGGAGSVGSSGGGQGIGGNGGAGLSYSISGSPVYYAGGGGGGACMDCSGTRYGGTGGIGGGGNGGNTNGSVGADGTPNTGGGAGGGSNIPVGAGGNGGSGIVIVRYL